jgi:hypothetical protein
MDPMSSSGASYETQEWLQYVEHEPARIRELYETAPPTVRAVIELLAERAPDRLTYGEIAVSLGWSPYKWPAGFGGWMQPRRERGEYSRPWHLCSKDDSLSGEWEVWMDEDQAAALREAATEPAPPEANGRKARVAHSAIRFIPPERNVVSKFVADVPQRREAHRREAELVQHYEQHLDALDIKHGRLVMPLEETKLYNDVYLPDRHQLVEAKGAVRRELIRMAIGQLADYAFQMSLDTAFESAPSMAVLLPERPTQTIIELLDSQGIAIVWATAEGFVDNRGGVFTS